MHTSEQMRDPIAARTVSRLSDRCIQWCSRAVGGRKAWNKNAYTEIGKWHGGFMAAWLVSQSLRIVFVVPSDENMTRIPADCDFAPGAFNPI